MRVQHPGLVQQGHPAFRLQHALDDEHHVRATRVVFVEHDGGRALKRPWQHAFPEFGDLHSVPDDDRVLADEIDSGNVAVQVDAHAGPIEACGDLLDMGGLAGPVIALNQHPAVMGESHKYGERGRRVEAIAFIHRGNVLARCAERGNLQVGVDPEGLSRRNPNIGHAAIQGCSGSAIRCHTRVSMRLQDGIVF